MNGRLPKPEEIKVTSLQDTEKIFQLLLAKLHKIEERDSRRDQGLVEEILHLRKETREGFENIDKRFENLEDKVDQNTFAIKSLEMVTNEKLTALEGVMKGGFGTMGKTLQEISNKLDR